MDRKYMDTMLQPEERAKILLKEMSLDEKMAQVNCIFPFNEIVNDFEEISKQSAHGIGAVSTLEMRSMETLDEVAAWQRKVQEIIMENSEHQIPAMFHMEGLCGAFIQDSTSFPSGISRGSGFDPELEEKIAEIVSRQEAACGITQIFAPVLDISRDSRMGRQGETYGEDPLWQQLWEWPIPEESRNIPLPEEKQKVWPSISWHFIILREVSMEPTAILLPVFWKKSTGNRSRQPSVKRI